MIPKLAIAIQVCPLDVWEARKLVQLICSIESELRADIEFIVSARRDTNSHAVVALAELARKKFVSVQTIRGKRFGTGWPNGCNDLWQETMMRVSQLRDTGKIKSAGVLTFESDCIPLRPDWLDVLAREWQTARDSGKDCVGHAHTFPGKEEEGPSHINGNAIFACDITRKHPEMNGCDARYGWDAFHGKLLLSIGKDTPYIYQRYRIQSITREEVEDIRKDGEIPALFHGIKKETGICAIEEMIKDGSFFTRINSSEQIPQKGE